MKVCAMLFPRYQARRVVKNDLPLAGLTKC